MKEVQGYIKLGKVQTFRKDNKIDIKRGLAILMKNRDMAKITLRICLKDKIKSKRFKDK